MDFFQITAQVRQFVAVQIEVGHIASGIIALIVNIT